MRARQVASMFVATVLLAVGISAPAGAQTPRARLDVGFAPGFPDPPVLNLPYRYAVDVGNTGDVPLDRLEIIDTLPVELTLSQVTTGSYSGLSDFAAGEGVRVSYEKNTALGVFTLWGARRTRRPIRPSRLRRRVWARESTSRACYGSTGRRRRACGHLRGRRWRGG